MNKSNIFEIVSKGVADILYTKKDGTERVIKALCWSLLCLR